MKCLNRKDANSPIYQYVSKLTSFCDFDETRTHNPRLRRAMLYPVELRNHPFVIFVKLLSNVIPKRFERLTHALEGRCSIQLSYGTILNCGAKIRVLYKLRKCFAAYFYKIFIFNTKRSGYEYFLGNLKMIDRTAKIPSTKG